jgi:hypothetical protein
MDTLSKLSHDADEEVALGAILGLGIEKTELMVTCY